LAVLAVATLVLLLAQSAVAASRAAAAADLAALAAADAARGITPGEPCAVARDVALKNGALLLDCTERPDTTVQVRTGHSAGPLLGMAWGLARAGPPPGPPLGPALGPPGTSP
jgi:secretion/DNA translocation related TadE-like protein